MISNIDIIISTRNRLKELLFTINKMLSIGFKEEQFFLIDDASEDNTTKTIKEKYPAINITKNETPKGYIINRNTLMKTTKKKYILSLDDDSHIRNKEDIEEAIEILESESKSEIFSFRLFEQIGEPPEKSNLSTEKKTLKSYIGCGHIISRKLIDTLKPYRAEFVFYGEELDYSIRAFQNGFNVVTKDNLVVHHRIDWKTRHKQKKNQNKKGIYGAAWRSKLGFSNHLIIIFLYYPYGLDFIFAFRYIILRFYNFLIKKGDFAGFFKGMLRFFYFFPFIINNKQKMNFKYFFKWIRLKSI